MHYFSYPRVTFFFWFFCLTALTKKNTKATKKQNIMLFVLKRKPKTKCKNNSLCILFLKKKPKGKRKKTKIYAFCF